MASVRGLVVSAPIEHSAGRLFVKSSTLDPQELRFSLLFWDKLDYPSNNIVGLASGSDVDFLISAGVMKRTHVKMGSGSVEDLYRIAHIRAFRTLDEAEPGTWSIATGERSISFLDEDLEAGRGALLRLHRAIPVPDKDVHLQDILEFKQKRQSELLALRYYLEAIYGRVSNASDGALALNSEFEALDRAVSDYIKSTRGGLLQWVIASVDANMNIATPLASGLTALARGLSLVDAALVAGAAAGAAITIKAGVSLSRAKTTGTPFRYVSSYHRDLFPPG